MDPFNLVDENPEPSKKSTRFSRFFSRKKAARGEKSGDTLPAESAPAAPPEPTLASQSTLPASFPSIDPLPLTDPPTTNIILEKSEQPTVQPIDPPAPPTAVQPIHPAAEQPAIGLPTAFPVQPNLQQTDPTFVAPSIESGSAPSPAQPNPKFSPSANGQSVVSVRDITKIYTMGDMEVHALRGINLNIQQGEMVAVMGPSGSGKSTLMNIIGCLDVPTAGEYLLDGVDVSELNDNALAEIRCHKIGFVFQSFNLLSRTSAIANVELPLIYSGNSGGIRRQRAADSLSLVGLGDRLDHKPNELSGGQQQRVAIARSLINQPAMILADEPTGNLDTATSVEIMQLFQKLNREQGITIVFVTHDPETAEYCQRVIHFRDGVIERDEKK